MNKTSVKWLAGCGGLATLVLFGCCVVGLVANLVSDSGPARPSSRASDLPTLIPTTQVATVAAVVDAPAVPTDTPAPIVPTDTPAPAPPTDTPVPTPPPSPVVLSGSGDAIQEVQMWNGPAIMQVSGNDESRHFAVIPHTVSGASVLSMVNTTEPYQGRVLLSEPVNRLEISATGAWTIEILPLSAARTLPAPGKVEGSGDEVLVLAGGIPDIATVTGNQAGRHFAVLPYTPDGQPIFGAMVNTTDPYEGQILLDGETGILAVTAVGPWSVAVETVE